MLGGRIVFCLSRWLEAKVSPAVVGLYLLFVILYFCPLFLDVDVFFGEASLNRLAAEAFESPLVRWEAALNVLSLLLLLFFVFVFCMWVAYGVSLYLYVGRGVARLAILLLVWLVMAFLNTYFFPTSRYSQLLPVLGSPVLGALAIFFLSLGVICSAKPSFFFNSILFLIACFLTHKFFFHDVAEKKAGLRNVILIGVDSLSAKETLKKTSRFWQNTRIPPAEFPHEADDLR